MKKRTCDKCGSYIADNNTLKGSVYQFSLTRDTFGSYEGVDYPKLKEVDLCYTCAIKAKIAIEKYLTTASTDKGGIKNG